MDLYTEQGTPLTLQLTARDRINGGHPQPIVEFRYSGGMLCGAYYLSDFMGVATGLCVDGGGAHYRQDLSAATVALCQAHCLNFQAP